MSISFHGAKKYKKHNGFSLTDPIKTPLPAPIYFFNLVQSDNIILTPLVKEGDDVYVGQKIADLEIFDSLPIHSSVSGKVISICNNVITIENDMLFTTTKTVIPASFDTLTTREILWIIRDLGICEVRTGIPAHVQLGSEKTPDYIVVCCFDSDPYVSSPQSITVNNTEKILKGLDIAMKISNTKKAIIAVENDTKKNFSDFKLNLRYNKNISLYSTKARYPQSDDNILIKTLTGKDIDNVNAVILSAETLYNIASVFETGMAVTSKVVTISGDDILPPNNYRAPLGLPINALLLDSGYTSPETVIYGGVIDGKQIKDLDIPINRQTKSIIAFNDNLNIPKYRKEHI